MAKKALFELALGAARAVYLILCSLRTFPARYSGSFWLRSRPTNWRNRIALETSHDLRYC
jgi:hypothetical protein